MSGKGTDINLPRLFTMIAYAQGSDSPGVVVSLDAEEAFDLVEWDYLWQVLFKFGFTPKFISWVQHLYSDPTARVRTNNTLSEPFPLYPGTRQ